LPARQRPLENLPAFAPFKNGARHGNITSAGFETSPDLEADLSIMRIDHFPAAAVTRRILALIFLLLFISEPALSQPPAGSAERQLSFMDAVKTALRQNSDLQAMASSVSAGREDVGVARSALLPKLSLEERYLGTDNPTYSFMAKLNQRRFTTQDFAIDSLNNPDAVNDYQTAITLEQPLFAPKAFIGFDMSKREFSARDAEFRRKQEEVLFMVAQGFLRVGTAAEYLKTAQRGVADAAEHLRVARLRYDSQTGLYSDILRANTALAEAEQRQVSARKNLSLAKRSLGLLMGLAEPVGVSGGIPPMKLRGIDEYRQASLSRQDIKSMELRTENARKRIRLSESGYLPTLGIGGSYNLNDHRYPFGSEGDSWQVMASLKWPIFEGLKREHETAKAKHQASETEALLKSMKEKVSFRIYEAFLNVEEAAKNAELARQALASAEEGKRLVEIRYEGAFSTLLDVLDAQLASDRARLNLIARENEHSIAILNLSFESGLIAADLNVNY
jgi:outer membrane protein TolC